MSVVDIFNFDESKIAFSAPVSSTSQEGGVSYTKIYFNYDGDKFNFELPVVEMTINENTKKKYKAFSSKIKLNICKPEHIAKIVEIFTKIYNKSAMHIEATKAKLNFKNKAKFKADKAEESGFNNPLYYIIDKETGEKTNQPPMIYANLNINNKDKTIIKYPSSNSQFKVFDYTQYLGTKLHCIPVLRISNLFIGSDGDIRLQLQLGQATLIKIIESTEFDQSKSFNKYGIDISSAVCNFSDLKNCQVSNVHLEHEEDIDLEDMLANTDC